MHRVKIESALALALLMLLHAGVAAAQARVFKVDSGGGSSVQFVSDAPLERFTGKTTKLSGTITVDPAHAEHGKADIEAEAGSIKTNVTLRDEHLASESWLDAKRYPEAHFVITKIVGAKALKPNDLTEVTVHGRFTLHGVTRDVVAKTKIRFSPGSKPSLRVQSSFTVHLEDYQISIPKLVSLKVSSDVVVNVDIMAIPT
ncbi:MAG: hypothetical protein JWN04_6640 [Myxococcaceae bacterium]|nr:hypothetical protein [Myxococcaceae bacterium]